MRKLALLAALLFAGCDDVVAPDGGDAGTETDAGPMDAGPPGDAGPYCPTGYAFVPFVTSTATTHTFDAGPDQVLSAGTTYAAVLETDQGRIVFDLYSSQAPITCNSFVFLALHHFFDGIAFHRVLGPPDSIAQGGDPNTLNTDMSIWGNGGPGYFFGLEVTPSLNYDGPGVVGMARTSDPNTNGSQFFIAFVARHDLDQAYSIFAKVSEGSDVFPKIVLGMPPANPTRMTEVHICKQ
jgi:peptidylprolyl isomerase